MSEQKSTDSTRDEIRNKLKEKLYKKRIGRMNRTQKDDKMNLYCKQIGMPPEQLKDLYELKEKFQKFQKIQKKQ